MSVVMLAAVCAAAALLGAWLVPRQLRRERQRTFAYQLAAMTRAMNEFAATVGEKLVPTMKAAGAAFQQFADALRPAPQKDRKPE